MDFMIVLINKIREQPNIYIGKKSVERLKAFLDGYLTCMWEQGEQSCILGDFQKYVQKRYNITSSQSWARIIDFFSLNEQDGLDLFFKLFDEFLETKQK